MQRLKNRFLCTMLMWLLGVTAFAQTTTSVPAPSSARLRALILSGGGQHDWRNTSSFLKELLVDSERFEVRMNETPAGLSAKTLTGFDLVVDDYSGPRLGPEAERALEAFVQQGKGLVVTHGGLVGPAMGKPKAKAWPGFARLTKTSWPATAAVGRDAPFQRIEIKTVCSEHPVLQGLRDPLQTADQPRRGFVLLSGAEILAATDKNEPLLFASRAGKGRVFCTTLGNGLGSMRETAFITTFLRGAEWAASGTVTLPTQIAMPGPATNGLRVLVIAGGHDHEAAFYSLFSGYKDIGWVSVSDSQTAFQQDLRAAYDVLVFYNFTRNLDDQARKQLRAFVESHKGIVVLHHGILNFQNWPWWYEEVVGGRYRLESQGPLPNSTVKIGQEHLIVPAGEHPITAGIGPFHVTDETYKGLFVAPGVKPLLTTDNPTSDRVVAWIGPCTTSKVVFVQLGHDHVTLSHPAYRALVHNAINWSGDKLQ